MDEPTPNPKDQRHSPDHLRVFTEHRAALFGAAYRVLGAVQDSEDAVQEAWLRWQKMDMAEVQSPRSYLLRIVSRTALNSLRTQQRRREDYPGPWLPEPISTDVDREPGQAAEIADDVSLALLVVLETLSPLERAAFVLREVFDLSYLGVASYRTKQSPAVKSAMASVSELLQTGKAPHQLPQ